MSICIVCNNSKRKSVTFWRNGGKDDQVMAFANQQSDIEGYHEHWFTIGTYKSLKNAKKAAVRAMRDHGYTFDQVELETLNFAD